MLITLQLSVVFLVEVFFLCDYYITSICYTKYASLNHCNVAFKILYTIISIRFAFDYHSFFVVWITIIIINHDYLGDQTTFLNIGDSHDPLDQRHIFWVLYRQNNQPSAQLFCRIFGRWSSWSQPEPPKDMSFLLRKTPLPFFKDTAWLVGGLEHEFYFSSWK